MTKNFVKIQSQVNITVTPGLQNMDVTNPDAHVPDRLKVQPTWPKAAVDIHEGIDVYPAYIAEWATVKALEKDKIITIGEYSETATEEATDLKKKLDSVMEEIQPKKKVKDIKLNDIAGEE